MKIDGFQDKRLIAVETIDSLENVNGNIFNLYTGEIVRPQEINETQASSLEMLHATCDLA